MLRGFGRYLGACGAIAAALVLGSPARAVTYAFDPTSNASNDFSISSGGETATFSSSSGPATFTVNPATEFFSFPVALGGFGNFSGDPLTITFSDPVMDRIIIPFGIFEAYATAPATLVVTSNTGQSAVFTTAFYDPVTGSPEGTVDFVPTAPLSSLTLTLTSPTAFAIASVDVPEPMSAALLAGGLILLALTRRTRVSGKAIAGRRTR